MLLRWRTGRARTDVNSLFSRIGTFDKRLTAGYLAQCTFRRSAVTPTYMTRAVCRGQHPAARLFAAAVGPRSSGHPTDNLLCNSPG